MAAARRGSPSAVGIICRHALLVSTMAFGPTVLAQDALPETPTQTEPAASPVPEQAAPEAVKAPVAADVTEAAQAATGFAAHQKQTLATALIASGHAQQAYELLAPLESDFSQDADYNYLLGLAGIESGRADEAVFSLQRAVADRPGFAGARMDLARAYFLAGDYVESRKAFNELRGQNPPPEAAAAIDRYLELIEAKQLDSRPHFGGGVEVEGGYDSNANSGTRNEAFGGFVLDPQSREKDSSYAGVGAVGSFRLPLTRDLRWNNALRLGYRHYPDAVFVAATGLFGSSDLVWQRRGGAQYSAGAFAGQQWLDGDANQKLYGLNAGAGLPLGESTRVAGNVRLGEARFDQLADLRLRQLSGSLALQWRGGGKGFTAFDFGPILGREVAEQNNAPFNRTLYGVQAAADWNAAGYDWHGALGYLRSDYATVPFFGHREDRQLSVRVSLDGPKVFGDWQIVPRLTVVDNESTLALYEYRRVDVGIALQRSFR